MTTTTLPPDLAETFDRLTAALGAMGQGDRAPYAALWLDSPDVTLYGAWGPMDRNHDVAVTHVLRRVDGRWWLVHRHADFPPADQRPGR